jgi:hypothetical protein
MKKNRKDSLGLSDHHSLSKICLIIEVISDFRILKNDQLINAAVNYKSKEKKIDFTVYFDQFSE